MASKATARKMGLDGEDATHQAICSYFLGPRGENLDIFKENIDVILRQVRRARIDYFPDEEGKYEFISEDIRGSDGFVKARRRLDKAVGKAAELLSKHSVPCWSPRYQAHMCTDMAMPALLGYFMAMLYNPNNVALEASPLTTVAEIEVGEQLCEMFGYNTGEDDDRCPTGWGHVTCGGTVANVEAMWAARNLKFYPLSLRKAFGSGGELEFLSSRFQIETCVGERKLLSDLSTWELLNLKAADVLDMPERLFREHGISNDYLSGVMSKYTIQSVGKDWLEIEFGMDRPAQVMLATSRHYSWPKGGALCGIGSANVVGVPVDDAARVDIKALDRMLARCVEDEQAVYAVVAIIGSTEEGAVDSLSSILALRKQYQALGLSFLVHADAAWGGYFCSMLPRNYHPGDVLRLPTEMGGGSGFVPDASLRAETQDDLYAMRFADSITVDPHKAGYMPYPAGGLCYRDGRMRFLLTWTSPYLSRGAVTSIGIYGVEGSKPGAAAMAAWLANKTIGLTQEGYGTLLAEVTWTCTRLAAEWAALTDESSPFVCVPFNKLPYQASGKKKEKSKAKETLEAEKARIRRDIVLRTNEEIVAGDVGVPEDEKAMTLMRALGSDLNINAFALNFRFSDGRLNDDVEEANYLTQRVVEALSVDSPTDDPARIPLYLTSTEFSDELYGDCKRAFMRRLGLAQSTQNLMVLRNVVMSPFPTDQGFIRELATTFYDVVAAETEVVRTRNEITPDFYSFLLQGEGAGAGEDGGVVVYAVHLPMFHVANRRQQLIMAVELDRGGTYAKLTRSNPGEPMILVTASKVLLSQVAERAASFVGHITTTASGPILRNVKVTVRNIVVSRPLNSRWRLPDYPKDFMPFYLYGSPTEANIDHVIVRAPNTQLSAGRCTLNLDTEPGDTSDLSWWSRPHILVLDNVYEAPMQPFPPNADIGSKHRAILPPSGCRSDAAPAPAPAPASASSSPPAKPWIVTGGRSAGCECGFFFRPGAKFDVSVYEDGRPRDLSARGASFDLGGLVGRGTLVLGDSVYVDTEAMNVDLFRRAELTDKWREEFAQIGKQME